MKKTGLIFFMLFLCSPVCLFSQGNGSKWRESRIDSIYNPAISETGRFLVFDNYELDTGTIKEEAGAVEYEFTWKNTGTAPVTVMKVSTTCACAVPVFERVPVGPGESSSLKVKYYPKGHPGKFNRKIFVYTDLSGTKPAAELSLKGNVEASDAPVWLYRYHMGNLYLRRVEVRFDPDRKAVERIMCFNAGDSPVTVSADSKILPPYISLRCEPETVKPGKEADLVITYDPGASPARILDAVPVILDGLEVPPSQRTLKVIFDGGR